MTKYRKAMQIKLYSAPVTYIMDDYNIASTSFEEDSTFVLMTRLQVQVLAPLLVGIKATDDLGNVYDLTYSGSFGIEWRD